MGSWDPFSVLPVWTPSRSFRRRSVHTAAGRKPLLQLTGIRSVARFEGTLRKAIHEFKYQYVRELAVPLGDMLVSAWPGMRLPVDLLLPVPLHRRRVRARGYKQSALLAKRFGERLGLPVATDLLVRHRNTLSQTRLDAEAPLHNVAALWMGVVCCSS